MFTRKGSFRSALIITAIASALIALTASCGGPKTVQKPDNEPGLRENKANMMNKMDTTANRR